MKELHPPLDSTLPKTETPLPAITPNGILYLELWHERGSSNGLQGRLVKAFAKGAAEGVLFLAGSPTNGNLPSAFRYWQELGHLFLTRVCALPEEEDSAEFPNLLTPEDELASMSQASPPIKGAEYLTKEMLLNLWREMDVSFREKVRNFKGGLKSYIATRYPAYHTVGRVCFHLAENKTNEDAPFAFLATYANRLSHTLKVQHLPLAKALDQYSGEKNKAALLNLLVPIQKASQRSSLIKELLDSGELYLPLAWTPADAYRFLKDIPVFETSGLTVRIPNWWSKKPPRPEVSIRIGNSKARGLGFDAMLDFSMDLTLGGEVLSPQELQSLLSASEGLTFIRGQWVEIDSGKLKEVLTHWKIVNKTAGAEGLSFLESMRLLSGAGIGKESAALEDGTHWSNVSAGAWLSEALDRLKNPDRLEKLNLDTLHAKLRPYQEAGVKWLWFLKHLGIGACLADDMGLGKTIQVIGLFLQLNKEKCHPHLIVVPASLIANWKSEMEHFAPTLKVFIAHPSATPPSNLKSQSASMVSQYDVVLTTYGSISRLAWVSQVDWEVLVLDEAQAIKNPNAKQTRAAKQLKSRFRIALTGTPIENRLSDLWSIFDFLSPGLLGSAKAFTDFSKKLGEKQNSYLPLRQLVRPYILRRLKTDKSIISDLPEKTEIKAFCTLTKIQAALYQEAVESLEREIKEVEGIKRRGVILSYLMRFKQICNHPSQWLRDGTYSPRDSGKFSRLKEICEEAAERQEKVLVFTQFREITKVLARFLLEIFGRPGLILHGDTNIKNRKAYVDQFQEELGPPFFVLSLKAGGTGLNLTQASHVLHFDRWWNPAVENQATDRAFRIGQKKNVLVHKFICRGTVEDKIDELIDSKRDLSLNILEGGSEKLLTEMTNKELLSLVSLDINRALEET